MRGKPLTQKEFEMIKSLQKAEIKQSDVSRLLKKSRGLVKRVYEADSLTSYKEQVREASRLRKLKKEADVGAVTEEITHNPSPKPEQAVALIYQNDLADLHTKLDLIISTLNKKKVIL